MMIRCFLLSLWITSLWGAPSCENALKGKLTYVNKQYQSLFIQTYQDSAQLFTNFATKFTSGGHTINFLDLKASQKVFVTYISAPNRFEVVSIDVTDPILPPSKPKVIEKQTFIGKIRSIHPLSSKLVVLAKSRMIILDVSFATQITKDQKKAAFVDLDTSDTVEIVAVRVYNNVYDPISIDIKPSSS